MTEEHVKNPGWIADELAAVPFVEWDRFVVEDHDGHQCLRIYGWIDRDDEYKDFVVARFWPEQESIGFTTSSDEHSAYLHEEWIGEHPDDHTECRRVENTFDVGNVVELDGGSGPAEFGDEDDG
jgi:hypothetical protein